MPERIIAVLLSLLLILNNASYTVNNPEALILSSILSSEKYINILSGSASIKVLGSAWSKVKLRALVIKPSWLDDRYIDAVVKAFEIWDRALESFGRSYGYEYLSEFEFYVSIRSYSTSSGYDIVVKFSGDTVYAGGEIGVTKVTYVGSRIIKAEITLYIYTTVGKLSPTDVLNIALHEIGHALGLGHSSRSKTLNGPELMYPYYTIGSKKITPSTLDVYALAKLYSWLKTGVFKTPGPITVILPSYIPYKMLLYYKVTISSNYGQVSGEGWYVEGATVTISINSTIIRIDEGVRTVFTGWSGDLRSSDPVFSFKIYKDVNIVANWKIQYYVSVTSVYSQATPVSGWYDSGTWINVSIQETMVDLGNSTRRIFKGWTGSINSSSPEIMILVDKPIHLVATWNTQYKVSLVSTFSKPLIESGWYDKGEVIRIGVENEVVDFGNKTRMIIIGWNGSIFSDKPSFETIVNMPLKLEALWVKEYYIEIIGVYSQPNHKSGWYHQSSVLNLSLIKRMVDQGNETRRVFDYWNVNGRRISAYPLVLNVSSPLCISAVWHTEYLVHFKVFDREGNPLIARVIMTYKGNIKEFKVEEEGKDYWLEKGAWIINKVLWLRFEQPGYLGSLLYGRKIREASWEQCSFFSKKLDIESPRDLILTLDVWSVFIRVVDFLGIPAPLYTVRIANSTLSSDLDGYLVKTKLAKNRYLADISFLGLSTGKFPFNVYQSGVIEIKVSISVYTVLPVVIILLLYSYMRRKRKSHKKKEND